MRLGRIAGWWQAVVGGVAGLLLLPGSPLSGLFFLAFFGLGAFLFLRATRPQPAQSPTLSQSVASPLRGTSILFLVWGQLLILAAVVLFFILQEEILKDPRALLLVAATLPPGILALIAALQIRRKEHASLSG